MKPVNLNQSLWRRFYVRNSENLKATTRPQWLSLIVIAMKNTYLFSLLMIPDYLSIDDSSEILQAISMHEFSPSLSRIIVISMFTLNAFIISLITYIFITFCLNPQQSQRNYPFLSGLVMNYNPCFVIPTIMISSKLIKNSDSQIEMILGIINIVWTLFISTINSVHSIKSYSFFNSKDDTMAKFGGMWDYLKHLILSIAIMVIEFMSLQQVYTYLIFVFLGINIHDLFQKNIFYCKIVNQAFFAMYLNVMCTAVIVQVQISILSESHITGIVIFICVTIPLSWVTSGKILNHYYLKLNKELLEFQYKSKSQINRSSVVSSNSTIKNSKDPEESLFTARERDYYLDFFTRGLLEKTSFFKKDQRVMQSLFDSAVSFPEEIDESGLSSSSTNAHGDKGNIEHVSSLIEAKEDQAVKSMKTQVKQLIDYFGSRMKHTQKSSSSRISMWELFYLLEIEQNLPKLAIQIQHFLHTDSGSRGSTREDSLVELLQDQLKEYETNIRNQTFQQNNNLLQRGETFQSYSDFSSSFEFFEELRALEESILKALRLKLDFLNGISQNIIDLMKIASIGSTLIQSIKNISLEILRLSDKSLNCVQLHQLTRIFVECLWIDPADHRMKLIKKLKISDEKIIELRQFLNKNTQNYRIDFNKINREECVVIASVSEKRFAKILKVSDNCFDVTGYSVNELMHQNCSLVMPTAISVHHNSIMHRGIESGIRRSTTTEQSPMILKTKQGFGVRIQLDLQINWMCGKESFSEIGFAAKLKVDQNYEENYILFDVFQSKCRIEVVSRNLYERLMGYYFTSPKDINGKELAQMIPVAAHLKDYMKKKQKRILQFQSLFFLPTGPPSYTKRRMQDTSTDVVGNAKKHYFDRSRNDVFLANFSATYFQKEGEYELIILKLEEFKQISNELENYSKNFFMPHLVEFTGISREKSQSIIECILNGKHVIDEHNALLLAEDGSSKNQLTLAKEVMPQAFVKSTTRSRGTTREDLNDDNTFVMMPGKLQINNTNFQGSNSETRFPSMMTINSPSKVEYVENFDNLHSRRTTSRTFEQNQISFRQQNSARLLVNQSNSQYCQSPQSDRQFLNDSRQIEYFKQETYLRQLIQDSSIIKLRAVNQTSDDRNPSNNNNNIIMNNIHNNNDTQDSESKTPKGEGINNLNNLLPSVMAQSKNASKTIKQHNNNNQGESHRGSVRSEQSQSTAQIEAVFRGIYNSSNSSLLFKLLMIILVSFLIIISIVCTVYLKTRSQLSSQELSFEYAWWLDQMEETTISMMRLTEAFWLIQFTDYAGDSSELNEFKNGISASNHKLYENALTQFDSLNQHDYEDLYLIELLFTNDINYMRYSDSTTYTNRTYSMMQAFQLYAFSSYQYATAEFTQKRLIELDLVQNMDSVLGYVIKLTQLQEESEKELIEDMKSIVLISMIAIICLSCVIGLILMPLYWALQQKKQFILKLFSSIEQESITKMYQGSVQGIFSIHEGRLNAMQVTTMFKGRNGNLEIQKQVLKTKKNLPTTELPKIHFRFALQLIVIFIVVNLQPIVNKILVSQQVSESETELVIGRSLYTLSTALVDAQYAMYATTEKAVVPQFDYLALGVFQSKMYSSIDAVDTSINDLQTTINKITSESRYTGTETGSFIKQIFTVNACAALNTAKSSYFEGNGGLVYDSDLCDTLYDGIFKQGFFHAINSINMMLTEYSQIVETYVTPSEYDAQFTYFYTINTPLKMENVLNLIKIAQIAVINCISEDKKAQIDTIDITQLILFAFEVIFLAFILPIVVYPFYQRIKAQILQIVELIQILQLQHIQENSYICSFIKHNQSN